MVRIAEQVFDAVPITAVETAVVCCAPLAAPVLDEQEALATAELFKALGDPARVRIVNRLATSGAPVCVCDLVGPLGSVATDGVAPSEEAARGRTGRS